MCRKIDVAVTALGMKTSEIAGVLGIPRTYFSGIKRGKIVPSQRIQQALSEFFGMPYNVLVEKSVSYDEIRETLLHK